MSFLSSWGAPSKSTNPVSIQPSVLKQSDENLPPSPPDIKVSNLARETLRNSKSEGNPLKRSIENVPAPAAAEPSKIYSISDRWKNLKKITDMARVGIAKVSSSDVDALYPDVPCYKDTQLKHAPLLHANLVKLNEFELICSQAPTESRFSHFWQAVCESEAIILDLSNEVKAYYPTQKEMKQGGWSITQIEQTNLSNKSHIQFSLAEYTATFAGKTHKVSRFSYSSWNDMSKISVEDLDHLVKVVLERKKDFKLLVHCKAGVGRTGTFAVATALYTMHLAGTLKSQVDKQGLNEVIDYLISSGRNQRGPMFVSSESQYALLHDYAEHLLKQVTP